MVERYAEVQGTTLIKYPYLFSDLQADNPDTNYGDNYDVAYWFPMTTTAIENGYTLELVIDQPAPTYDANTEICTQNAEPTLVEGVWVLGWTVSEMTPEQKAAHDAQVQAQNKTQASNLLTATDWTAIPSVADPAQSNPYLANQAAFLTYRSQLRQIAVNPPTTPVTAWPTIPVEDWKNS
jgi:hypothetical protein